MPGNVSYWKPCDQISLQSMILLLKISSWKLYTLSQINDFAASNLCLALEENKSLKSLNLEVGNWAWWCSSLLEMGTNCSWSWHEHGDVHQLYMITIVNGIKLVLLFQGNKISPDTLAALFESIATVSSPQNKLLSIYVLASTYTSLVFLGNN